MERAARHEANQAAKAEALRKAADLAARLEQSHSEHNAVLVEHRSRVADFRAARTASMGETRKARLESLATDSKQREEVRLLHVPASRS